MLKLKLGYPASRRKIIKKELLATVLAVSLLTSVGTYMKAEAQELSFINIDLNNLSVISGDTNAKFASVNIFNNPRGIAVNPTTNTIYAVNQGSDSVSVIDGATNTATDTISIGFFFPEAIAVNPSTNTIYVTNLGTAELFVIDGTTNSLVTSVFVGSGPRGVAVNPSTNTIYVANQDSSDVSVIDGATNSLITSIFVGTFPEGIDVNPSTNMIYVANQGSNDVSVIDGATNEIVATIPVGTNPRAVAVNPSTNKVYVANFGSNNVSVIDGATNTVSNTIAVGTNPRAVAVNPSTNKVYVANFGSNSVSVIDGATNTVTNTISIGIFPEGIAVNPTTNRIYVNNALNPADFPFGIECGDPTFVYVTIHGLGLLAKINKSTKQFVEFIDDPHSLIVGPGQNFYSIARDPNTGNLYVNERDNGKLWRYDPSTNTWTPIPLIEQIVDIVEPNDVQYVPPLTYEVAPDKVTIEGVPNEFVVNGFGGVVFANGNIWVALDYIGDFTPNPPGVEDVSFSGLVKVNPSTLAVEGIEIEGASLPTGLVVDSTDQTILWVTDKPANKVYRFNTVTGTLLQTITHPLIAAPRGIATDDTFIYVARDLLGPGNSTIAKISRSNPADVTLIDTNAPIDVDNFGSGTFTVFVSENDDEGNQLIWTDRSGHVGVINTFTNEKTVFTTARGDENHFGCIPFDGEFWFAGRGSAKVGIMPNSKFSVGGIKRPTSRGGSDPTGRNEAGFAFGTLGSSNYDDQPPSIEEVFTSSGSLKVSAKILDNVGVRDANLIVSKNSFPMKQRDGNPVWWEGIIPASGEVSYKIVARDFNKNIAEYSGSAEGSAAASGTQREGASLAITPSGQQTNPGYSIIAGAVSPGQNTNQQITIKNTTNEPLKNIRLVLSPELKGKFLLSGNAIKSIAPDSEATVLLRLNGNPNVDVMKEPIPYDGQIIVMIDNHSPLVLKLNGNIPNESSSLHSLFMKMIGNKAEQRYKSFEKPDERILQDAEYEVKLGSGDSVIKSASDELIITNNGDKPLKNLRIITSSVADHFLPDQKNIALVPAGSFIKVKLVSNLNNAASRDLSGELIVVPENGVPVTIPINIEKRLLEDKNELYEVNTISGNDAISNTADGIIIRNNSEGAIDNLRIILPRELARVLSISEYSFKSIEPNAQKTVYLQPRGTLDSRVKHILNDYTGQIIIVSSDGMKKVIPVNIVWKGISSEHFVIYARDNTQELTKATQVINSLERSYSEVRGMLNGASTKTVIYMTSSLDELKMLSDALAPSTYVYDEDVAFVWSNSEDVNMLVLKEFAYRTIMQNYASYWTKQKISADNGNWLVDGVSNYVATRIVGERGMIKQQLDAFITESESFEWYGAATPSQYGATYTLFKFLAEKYGDGIIDKALGYLGSTMVSNHRCDTLEQCALLRAVYDMSELDIDDKRNTLSFKELVEGWRGYVEDNYRSAADSGVYSVKEQ